MSFLEVANHNDRLAVYGTFNRRPDVQGSQTSDYEVLRVPAHLTATTMND
jgi:hypothetical protein